MNEEDKDPGAHIKKLRKDLRDIKDKFGKGEQNLIDIGSKPVLAMEKISQPIFDRLR